MTANTPSTRKAKGRKFQNEVAQRLRFLLQDITELSMEDIESCIKPAIMGESGKDIQLDKFAKETLGRFAIECKNTERANVWQWVKQAEQNASDKEIPIVFFKRNRQQPYAIIDMESLFELIRKAKN
jgi:hypothetical protein